MTAHDKPRSVRRQIVTSLSHLLFIVIIFVLPELVMAIAMPHRHHFAFYPGFYFKTLIFITAFYLNYFLIIDRTIGRSDRGRSIINFVLLNLLVIAAGLTMSYLVSRFMYPSRPPRAGVVVTVWSQMLKTASLLLRDAVMLILTIGLSVALRLSVKWKDIDRQKQELLANQRATELDSLKNQLNPHFLFNSLNTIYVLVDISPDDARKALHRLSGLLRYMLYEDVRTVRLRQEADFIDNYVALMRLRLSNREVVVDVELGDNDDAPVPPLLFIPLIENAFKYGTQSQDYEPVYISLKAGADTVVCRTRNSFTIGGNAPDGERSSGIGLANLRRRLHLIYGSAASFSTSTEGNTFTAELVLPLSKRYNSER